MKGQVWLKVRLLVTLGLVLSAFLLVILFAWQYQQPFIFANFRTHEFRTFDDALKNVNFIIEHIGYIAEMDAIDKGYRYLGYTFTIEKTSYNSHYTVHFQWWAKR